MNFKHHNRLSIILGIVSFIISFILYSNPIYSAIGAGVSYVFGLYPDLDIKSIPTKFFYGLLLIFNILIFSGLLLLPLQWIIIPNILILAPSLTKHRGFFHTMFPAMIYSITCLFLLPSPLSIIVACSLFNGYMGHLVLDNV